MKVASPTIFLFVTLLGISLAKGQTTPPNIVIILADDLGYGDVGFNGCPDIPTPNIDSLAANGVLCTNGYSTHPFCSPSRAGLLTGRYQQRFGHENNLLNDETNPRIGIPATEILLPQLLKGAGYVCGAFGKWHVGPAVSLHPLSRGFDEFYGFIDGSSGYLNATVLDGETPVVETEYLTDAFTREAISFIDRHATQPFFLYLPYNAPHAPYTATPAYLSRVPNITDPARKTYAAMIVAEDDGVGAVLAELQAQNLLSNTLIFFLSDNGAPNHPFTRNYPLRGYKGDTLEGGIRVPFAVQWTGRLPAHVVYNDPVSALDIFPTVAAAAGITLPTDRTYDGLDITSYLAGEQTPPVRTLFWRWLGLGQLTGPAGSYDTIWAVRSGTLKLITETGTVGQPPALYDLSTDIGETTNLAATRPLDVIALQDLYGAWDLQTIPPLWQSPTDFLGSYPHTLVLAGDWDGFNKDDSAAPWAMPRLSAPADPLSPDGFNWFCTTVHAAANGGDTTPGTHTFALIGGNSYQVQWGGATIGIDAITQLPAYSGTTLGPTNSISFDDGFYYSFRILDPVVVGPALLGLSVMKTSAPPVTVTWAGQVPLNPTSDDSIVVNVTTSQPKSLEEHVYLRWTSDDFKTLQLVEAMGTDVSYSATIPPQPAGKLLQYSIFTSTAAFSSSPTAKAIDPMVLSTTATYSVPVGEGATTPPIIVTQPAPQTVVAGQTATFSVSASGIGPLSYQWTKNGTMIDGATSVSYTTPPTTMTDNGSLFAVIVSDSGGSVTSNSAALTVTSPQVPPSITTQPASVTVAVGQTARFRIKAVGTPPLRYQWTKNGVIITGANRSSYTTAPATTGDNGALFAVTVKNRYGSVTSNNATLTVR